MSFNTDKIGDVVLQSVNIERATFKEAEEFKKLLDKSMDDGYSKFIIDLSKCSFIDSTFLSTIVTCYKKISKKGGSVKLVGVHDEVLALLELTGIVKIFEIYKSNKDAIESFRVKAA